LVEAILDTPKNCNQLKGMLRTYGKCLASMSEDLDTATMDMGYTSENKFASTRRIFLSARPSHL